MRSAHVKVATTLVLVAAVLAAIVACGGGDSTTSTTTTTTTTTTPTTTPATNTGTAGVLCNYSYSALNTTPAVNALSTANWSCTSTARVVSANGLPDHATGAFPNANNPNAMSAQAVSASYTLAPALTGGITTIGGPTGNTGTVLNGVKIDAGTGGSCNDSGASCSLLGNVGGWNIEALGQSSFNFGVDANNAHVQPGGVYHYHGMPEGFITRLGKGTAMTLIGWAADGFPIYARWGYSSASDASSAVKVMKASYRFKATPSANRPATTLYAMGTFVQDYEYVAGLGDLDECNGRTGVTPEFPAGTYHYFATDTYPYLQRCVKGTPAR